MTTNEIRSMIEKAFEGVTLEGGTSILQTQVMDKYGEGYTDKEFEALAAKDIRHDWKLLTLKDLDKCLTAHLDDKGFRYYIPALMCSVLDSYAPVSMRVIGTLSSLYPRSPSRQHAGCEKYIFARYEIFNLKQRQAIAQFLRWSPDLAALNTEDQKIVRRSIRNYWNDYL